MDNRNRGVMVALSLDELEVAVAGCEVIERYRSEDVETLRGAGFAEDNRTMIDARAARRAAETAGMILRGALSTARERMATDV